MGNNYIMHNKMCLSLSRIFWALRDHLLTSEVQKTKEIINYILWSKYIIILKINFEDQNEQNKDPNGSTLIEITAIAI